MVDDDEHDDEGSDVEAPEPPRAPPTVEQAAWRRSFAGRADVQSMLWRSLDRCKESNRMDILNEGCADAFDDHAFPDDEESALPFLVRKVRNARDRFYYRVNVRAGTEVQLPDYDRVRELAPPPPGELERAGEVAEALAAENPADARALAMMQLRYLHGAPVREVAATFETTEEAVRKAQSRFSARVIAAMAGVVGLILLFFFGIPRRPQPQPVDVAQHESPSPSSVLTAHDRALAIQAEALDSCDRSEWTACLAKLDEAAALDPSVDQDDAIQMIRVAAGRALAPAPEQKAPKSDKAPTRDKAAPRSDKAPIEKKAP